MKRGPVRGAGGCANAQTAGPRLPTVGIRHPASIAQGTSMARYLLASLLALAAVSVLALVQDPVVDAGPALCLLLQAALA